MKPTKPMEPKHDYWYWIGQGVAELDAWGFFSERTLAGFRRWSIDPVQVHLGWASLEQED